MSDVIKRFYFNEADQKVTLAYVQDVTDLIEENKRLQSEPQHNETFQLYARIPDGKMLEWLNEEWLRGNWIQYNTPEFWEMVDRKLDDPDNKYLRTDCPRPQVGWGK